MNLQDIIGKLAGSKIPKKMEFLLNGAFAFSHRGEFESPNQPASGPTAFIPQTQVGYLVFDGQGGVSGEITVNRNGGASQVVTPSGTYKLKISNGIATGTINTTSQFDAATTIGIEYAFIITNDWKEIKYAVQKATVTNQSTNTATTKKVLVWGTMRKIYT